MHSWQLQDAKARLSELIKSAETEGPQEITVRGEPSAVVLSKPACDRLRSPKPRFVDFLRASPLVGAGLDLARDDSFVRDVRL